ncbi:MAG: hypothetical protein ACTSXG_01300 [Alphaproteobacteria bacterium]
MTINFLISSKDLLKLLIALIIAALKKFRAVICFSSGFGVPHSKALLVNFLSV